MRFQRPGELMAAVNAMIAGKVDETPIVVLKNASVRLANWANDRGVVTWEALEPLKSEMPRRMQRELEEFKTEDAK